ncbi:DnaJ subfamily B member 14 [Choanephora cucurbitarum]|uniref:DnaJ subfamily B member 14 n=1 Tax=Choanephora cucurbitarum TaxID=101091 RepID=A0A1C7NS87_9FUNG|nr:DnaJ subfamily B member 14 [Choanephora cucurbitarum]
MPGDEALKCLTIAKSALGLGNLSKALKFCEKSIRLFPTTQGEQLLSAIKSSTRRSDQTGSFTPEEKPKQRQFTESVTSDRKYTQEQLQAVKTILACGRDYYKVLSVERSATDAQIKKAYRKQALQFHPDKNSAPGADEAFKLVAKAFDVLSDSNKRAIHDEGGDIDNNRGRTSNSYYQPQHTYQRRYTNEVTPEDLFNMFFGGGMRNGFGTGFRQQQQYHQQFRSRQQQSRFGRQQQQQQQQRQYQQAYQQHTNGLTQFLPIILLLLVAVFAMLFSFEGEPTYSFRPTPSNTNLRTTQSNHINYYVNPNVFDTTIKNNRYKFKRTEKQIESDWLNELRHACQQEQRHKSNLLSQADGIMFGIIGRNEKAYKKAQNMKLKHCNELRRLSRKIRN